MEKEAKEVRALVLLIIILVAASFLFNQGIRFSPDGFNYHGENIQANYAEGQNIRGTVTLSLEDFPADALLTTNFNGSITVLDLLLKNNFAAGVNFSCNNSNCENDYTKEETVNSVAINTSGEVVGFSISGNDVLVSSVNLGVSSNAAPSCSGQLYMDPLDDDKEYVINTETSGQDCEATHSGCFNPTSKKYRKGHHPW